MKYIIMCGGTYTEFEKPRQLTEVFGETLVGRTIRLLRENGVEDIAISTTMKGFDGFGVPILQHHNDFSVIKTDKEVRVQGWWVDAFYPADEPVCYLFGDVYFSSQAIQTIVEYTVEDVMFFASGPYAFGLGYIKYWSEPFAFKVEDVKYFQRCIKIIKDRAIDGVFLRHPISWELWQVIRGTEMNVIKNNYCQINDYTCDIDHPEDARMIELNITRYGLST